MSKSQIVLSPTPTHTPTPTILYRTLPRYANFKSAYFYDSTGQPGKEKGKMMVEDKALRPDLRLARSDPGLRRVSEFAKWFATWVDGEGPG